MKRIITVIVFALLSLTACTQGTESAASQKEESTKVESDEKKEASIIGTWAYVDGSVVRENVNMIFNKVIFFQLSSRKNLWSITLGILILGLYFLYRILFPNYSNVSGIVARIALDIAYNIFATNCLIMFGLSILLNIILKRFKVEV